jgi:Ca2+-transporting ATPase
LTPPRFSAFHEAGRNPIFWLIAFGIVAGQLLTVQFGGNMFRTVPLSFAEWAAVIGATGAMLLIGEIVRLIHRKIEKNTTPKQENAF